MKTPNTKPYPDEFWQWVADIYRANCHHRDVCQRIAQDHGVPVKTVHRWVSHCRHIGLLGKTRPGKAGHVFGVCPNCGMTSDHIIGPQGRGCIHSLKQRLQGVTR